VPPTAADRTAGSGSAVPYGAFYEPTGPDTFLATPATAGPWDAAAQHAGPPSALLARAFERHEPVDGQQLARISVDILRPVPVAPLRLRVRTLRPGRLITLLEATVEAGEQEVLYARAWRVAGSPSPAAQPSPAGPAASPAGPASPASPAAPGSAAGGAPVGPPLPDLPEEREQPVWPAAHRGGYMSAMDWRFASGAFTEAGPARAWMRPRVPLVAGEATSPASLALLVADSANGISGTLDPSRWLFVNVDLTVVLHRQPEGEWLLLDAETTVGAGVGLAASRLSDRYAAVGRGMQTLVVTPRR
jgi:acyl-Coa thioesterase superfamily protein/acyl-CoA thioesterase superfamily protein